MIMALLPVVPQFPLAGIHPDPDPKLLIQGTQSFIIQTNFYYWPCTWPPLGLRDARTGEGGDSWPRGRGTKGSPGAAECLALSSGDRSLASQRSPWEKPPWE